MKTLLEKRPSSRKSSEESLSVETRLEEKLLVEKLSEEKLLVETLFKKDVNGN